MLHTLKNRIALLIIAVLIISVVITNVITINQVNRLANELIGSRSYYVLTIAKNGVNNEIQHEREKQQQNKNRKSKLKASLQRFFADMSSPNDFIFIFNGKGKIIVKSKNISLNNLEKILLEKKLTLKFIKCINENKKYCTAITSIALNNQPLNKWSFSSTKTNLPNWFLVHATCISKLKLTSHKLIIDLLFINSCILIIGLIISMLVITKLTKPLHKLSKHLNNLPKKGFSLNEETKNEIKKIAEEESDISSLAKAFLQLNTSLHGYIINLKRTTAIKERIIGELKSARKIQLGLLPDNKFMTKDNHSFTVHALLKPAYQVGGDFYDFALIDKNHFYFSVGDVSDKSIASALFMAIAKTLINTKIKKNLSPGIVLSKVNAELINFNKSNMFVTLFIGVLNTETGELLYTNAGHQPPILLRKNQSSQFITNKIQPVLGIFANHAYKSHKLKLSPNDLLFVYTDGVTDAANNKGELFQEKNLIDFINKNGSLLSVKDIIQRLLIRIARFARYESQADDITMFALRYRGSIPNMNTQQPTTTNASQTEKIGCLTLPAVIDSIEKFRQFIIEQTKTNAHIQNIMHDICLATEEAVINIIKHAYPKDQPGNITLDIYSNKDNSLTIRIQDKGIPFDPTKLRSPQPNNELEHLTIGGLGCHLINQLTDELTYNFKAGENILTLKFNYRK